METQSKELIVLATDGDTKGDFDIPTKYEENIDDNDFGMDAESRLRYEFYLRSKKDDFVRMDITAGQLKEMSDSDREVFLEKFLPNNSSIKTIHLSGHKLDEILDTSQIDNLVSNTIGNLPSLQELFVFQGSTNRAVTEDMISKLLQNARNVTVMMMWQFYSLHQHPSLAGTIRMHPSLERLTINIPPPPSRSLASMGSEMTWGCYDLYVMAMAGMPKLRVLQIRCLEQKQTESIISPDAITVLLQSKSIESLYLENVGLMDDHVDAICNELVSLKTETSLTILDLKGNMFSEDAMYTFGYSLHGIKKLQCLDISGVQISSDSGRALADGILHKNVTLHNLELEGIYENYADEFAIPDGHKYTDWNQTIFYQLRLNRAYHYATIAFNDNPFPGPSKPVCRVDNEEENPSSNYDSRSGQLLLHPLFNDRRTFVEAVSHVSDQLSCIYYFLRMNHKLFANHLNHDMTRWIIHPFSCPSCDNTTASTQSGASHNC